MSTVAQWKDPPNNKKNGKINKKNRNWDRRFYEKIILFLGKSEQKMIKTAIAIISNKQIF